jgi:hypothetical protein
MSTTIGAVLSAFKTIDKDNSGGITATELKNGRGLLTSAVRNAIKSQGADKVLKGMDADGNGTLSSSELQTGVANMASSSTVDALIQAQESQSKLDQMLVGLKSAALTTLPGISSNDKLATTAQNVLAAYQAGGKI